jgi:hypothetical protein
MANQEHLDMLKRGVDTWNRWREEHPEIQPDLSKVDLSVNFFVQANLSSTNLFGTNLSVSNCIMANFSKARCHTDFCVLMYYADSPSRGPAFPLRSRSPKAETGRRALRGQAFEGDHLCRQWQR